MIAEKASDMIKADWGFFQDTLHHVNILFKIKVNNPPNPPSAQKGYKFAWYLLKL